MQRTQIHLALHAENEHFAKTKNDLVTKVSNCDHFLQHRDRLRKLEEQSKAMNNKLNFVETLQGEMQNIKRLEDRIVNLEEKTNETALVAGDDL